MPNSYFKFKQFTIHQDRSAQKVCTDSCVFGAWITPTSINGRHNILDIGTGTGLLSLMIAQRMIASTHNNKGKKEVESERDNTRLLITAIEIEHQTAEQAQENVQESPFYPYINILQEDIRDWSKTIPDKTFTSVVCNPPFFSDSMPSSDVKRLQARHSVSLSYDDVCRISSMLLMDGGELFLLYPYSQHDFVVTTAATHNLYPSDIMQVSSYLDSEPHRICIRFIKADRTNHPNIDSLAIYQSDQSYTPSAHDLLKEYYLYL